MQDDLEKKLCVLREVRNYLDRKRSELSECIEDEKEHSEKMALMGEKKGITDTLLWIHEEIIEGAKNE